MAFSSRSVATGSKQKGWLRSRYDSNYLKIEKIACGDYNSCYHRSGWCLKYVWRKLRSMQLEDKPGAQIKLGTETCDEQAAPKRLEGAHLPGHRTPSPGDGAFR